MDTIAIETNAVMEDGSWDPDFFKKLEDDKLEKMGYKQQLDRNWNLVQSFGISLSAMGVGNGLITVFGDGLATGGPATMVISWIVVSMFNIFVVLAIAEIVSTTPLSGGPYSWSAAIAPSGCTAFIPWITGWFNLLGLTACTGVLSFSLAQLMQITIAAKTDYEPSPGKTIAILIAILCSWTLVNAFGRSMLRYFLGVSILLNTVGILAVAMAILIKAGPKFQSASFVFKTFADNTGVDGAAGWGLRASHAYVACLGSITAQITILGYDASAHVSEETEMASWAVPVGMVLSTICAVITGFVLLLALLFSMHGLENTLSAPSGSPVFQITIDVFGLNMALVLLCIIMIFAWMSGLFFTTCTSRLIFALSRDRGLPHFLSKVNEKSLCPVRSIFCTAFFALCQTLPSLASEVAFGAFVSITGTGILLSYAIPIATRLIFHEHFTALKGPFSIGRFSRPIALVALLWITFMVIMLCLPTQTPVTGSTFNYAPVVLAAIALLATITWPIARKQFAGPVKGRLLLSDHGEYLKNGPR